MAFLFFLGNDVALMRDFT